MHLIQAQGCLLRHLPVPFFAVETGGLQLDFGIKVKPSALVINGCERGPEEADERVGVGC